MRNFTVLAALLISNFSFAAPPGLLAQGCYQERDTKVGAYFVKVSIYTDSILVNYVTDKNQGLGGYRGIIYSHSNLTPTPNSVSVGPVTLNDGYDGYIEDAEIEITPQTVTLNSKYKKKGPRPKVECPK